MDDRSQQSELQQLQLQAAQGESALEDRRRSYPSGSGLVANTWRDDENETLAATWIANRDD
jgi:hypothetical protein